MIQRKPKPTLSQCLICRSPALYKHFGVISCNPCKMFFKRNALSQQNLICDFHGQCDINIYNRHVCSACRLAKCFSIGMKVELIRLSSTHNQSINKNRTKPSKQIIKFNHIQKVYIINLLEYDNSSFSNNDWIHVSNITHSYDESKLFMMSQYIQSEHDSSKYPIIIKEELVKKFTASFYETTGQYLCYNNDIKILSFNNRSVLLHTAADNITCLSAVFVSYHSQLINHEVLTNFFEILYGKTTMINYRRSTKYVPMDSVIFKLAIPLLAFASNARTFHKNIDLEFDNPNEILVIQNKYAELTWKYLIYKYGYFEAVRQFMTLIQWFVSLTMFISCANSTQLHSNDIESLVELTEIRLLLDDGDRIVDNN